MEHDHAPAGAGTRRILAAIAVNVGIVVAEAAGAWWTGSLALVADAGHNLTDVGVLVLAALATAWAARPASAKRSFGHHRWEILAALANGLLLVVVSIVLVVEAARRMSAPPAVDPRGVALFATVSLVGNLVAAGLLVDRRHNLNVRAAFLHLVADALSSVGVIVAAGLVMLGEPLADPVAAAVIALVIVLSGWSVLRESVDILLQGTPRDLDVVAVKRAVEHLPMVEAVHDLHVWSLTSGRHVASLHVVVEPSCLPRCDEVVASVTRKLHDEFAIEHTTVQVETTAFRDLGPVHD